MSRLPSRGSWPRRLGGGLAFALLMVSGVGVVSWIRIWRAGRRDLAAPADAIVVFGAAVWPSGPSPTLRLRARHAAALHRRGLAPRVVCSGGRSGGRSEPEVMAELLRADGVPGDALVLDEDGTTTRATLDSVVALGGGAWRRIVAVSSPYHVFRIVAEARRHGVTALPSAARRGAARDRTTALRLLVSDARQYAREVIAVWAYRLPRRSGATGRGRGARVTRILAELAVRWRTFAHDADALRAASSAITAAIRARGVPGEQPMTAPPRLTLPVEGRITSTYGLRHGRLHEGVDIAQPAGTPVPAVRGGVVVLAGELPVYGRVVVVEHGRDLATVYAHLARIDVEPGQRVDHEQRLGTVGVSGRSFGPHLHFEVRLDGTAVDPRPFLD